MSSVPIGNQSLLALLLASDSRSLTLSSSFDGALTRAVCPFTPKCACNMSCPTHGPSHIVAKHSCGSTHGTRHDIAGLNSFEVLADLRLLARDSRDLAWGTFIQDQTPVATATLAGWPGSILEYGDPASIWI